MMKPISAAILAIASSLTIPAQAEQEPQPWQVKVELNGASAQKPLYLTVRDEGCKTVSAPEEEYPTALLGVCVFTKDQSRYAAGWLVKSPEHARANQKEDEVKQSALFSFAFQGDQAISKGPNYSVSITK